MGGWLQIFLFLVQGEMELLLEEPGNFVHAINQIGSIWMNQIEIINISSIPADFEVMFHIMVEV